MDSVPPLKPTLIFGCPTPARKTDGHSFEYTVALYRPAEVGADTVSWADVHVCIGFDPKIIELYRSVDSEGSDNTL